MYRSFTIKNFRCFHDLTFAPLERVNLIAGMNNAGKTTLLEALLLHIGPNNPELPLRVNMIRGLPLILGDAEETWGWLFFNKRTDDIIELSSVDGDNKHRSLRIHLAELGTTRLAPAGDADGAAKPTGMLTTAAGPRDLTLEYQDGGGPPAVSRAFMTADGVKSERARLAPFPLGAFLSSRTRSFPHEETERFSKLDAVGRQDEVLKTMQILEPRLRRLAVLVTGGTPIIHGDIGIGHLVPLSLAGEGMVRLLSILLAIISAPHGTILIDEIENGLHHTVLVNVWKAIADAARQYETQVFATTHSWECIQAAHQAFEASGTYDFRLHRLDRIKDEIRAVTYDQAMLSTAIATDLEVR